LPDFVDDGGRVLDSAQQQVLLSRIASAGLAERLARGVQGGHPESAYRERLASELAMVERMGFAGYFLVVEEFCRWARANGVPLGPGRGSAAGSLVVWCCGITDLDPVEHGLYFERFLNLSRCFPGWTLVLTRRGEVPISQIAIGDEVWTRGGWRRVLRTMDRFVDEELTELQYVTDGKTRTLTATKNHGVFQSRACYPHRVEIDKLEVGDAIAKRTGAVCVPGMSEGHFDPSVPGEGLLLQGVHAQRAGGGEEDLQLPRMWQGVSRLRLQEPDLLLKGLQAQPTRRHYCRHQQSPSQDL
jgi:hypothetical protein